MWGHQQPGSVTQETGQSHSGYFFSLPVFYFTLIFFLSLLFFHFIFIYTYIFFYLQAHIFHYFCIFFCELNYYFFAVDIFFINFVFILFYFILLYSSYVYVYIFSLLFTWYSSLLRVIFIYFFTCKYLLFFVHYVLFYFILKYTAYVRGKTTGRRQQVSPIVNSVVLLYSIRNMIRQDAWYIFCMNAWHVRIYRVQQVISSLQQYLPAPLLPLARQQAVHFGVAGRPAVGHQAARAFR